MLLRVASSEAQAASPRAKRRALGVSVVDGLVHAVMLGVTENFLGALAVELGHSATHQALLATLPVLFGALSQLLAPGLTRLFGSRKRFVVFGAALQAASHLGFIYVAQHEVSTLWPLMLAKITYVCGGTMIAPAWSAWMAELTHGHARERYFARRSGAIHLVLLAAFVGGGQLLHQSTDHHVLLDQYTVLFWLGLCARCTSSLLLSAQLDPSAGSALSLRSASAGIRLAFQTANFRVAIYLTILMFGANIAVPFFVPYWLRELHLDYRAYAVLIGTATFVKALVFPSFHRLAERFGMQALLYTAGLIVALLPGSWAFASTMPAYVAIQALSGAAWGAIEYASFQLLLRDSNDDCRLEFLSIAGAINGVGQVLGSLLGSALIDRLQLAYTDVFWISSAVRCVPILFTFVIAGVTRRKLPEASITDRDT